MGQKVMPIGLRLGITENWRSRWYAGKDYAQTLAKRPEDPRVPRPSVSAAPRSARSTSSARATRPIVELWTARPGIVIGKKGAEVDVLRKELEKITGGTVAVNIIEIKRPELDAVLIAQSVAEQLEGRVAFRRAMRKAVASAIKSGALGIRIQCSGRLGGAEMGRREWYREGRVPLHTLRAKIDYGTAVGPHDHGRRRRQGLGLPRRGSARPGAPESGARGRALAVARVAVKGDSDRCFCRSE